MRLLARSLFLILLTALPLQAQAQSKQWSFNCQVPDCRAKYWPTFKFIEQELNMIEKWLTSQGFGKPKLRSNYARAASSADEWVTGPHIRLQVPEHFILHRHKNKSGTTLGQYIIAEAMMEFNAGPDNSYLNALAAVAPAGEKPVSVDDLSDAQLGTLREGIDTLAHEMYHAVQFGEGGAGMKHDWIVEGTASAVGEKYAQLRTGASWPADMKFDEMLNESSGTKAYDRGYFFAKAGLKFSEHAPVKYLAGLFGSKGPTGYFGMDWLDAHMRSKGHSLHEVYNYVVAEHASNESDYHDLEDEIVVSQPKQPEIKESFLNPFSAAGRNVWFQTGSFKVPDHTEETAFLPLATLDIPEGQGPEHARLIAGKKLAKKKRLDYLVDPERIAATGVQMLTRVTNMPRRDIDYGNGEDISLRAQTAIVEFSKPSCVVHGETWVIETENLPEDYETVYTAKRGKVSADGIYTAPSSGQKDEVFVEAYGRNGIKPTSLGEIELSKDGCPFQLLSSDGYSFTFDPGSKMSLAKGPSGPEQAYFDREHIYGYDPSMGWVKMHKSVMARFGAQMSKDTGGLMDLGDKLRSKGKKLKCKPYDNTGPDPFTWGRAPYDFLQDLEYNRLAPLAKTCEAAITLTTKGATCPARAPGCRVITILGKDSIVYNKGKQIVEIQLGDGTVHQVKRVNKRISAPEGARLIKF